MKTHFSKLVVWLLAGLLAGFSGSYYRISKPENSPSPNLGQGGPPKEKNRAKPMPEPPDNLDDLLARVALPREPDDFTKALATMSVEDLQQVLIDRKPRKRPGEPNGLSKLNFALRVASELAAREGDAALAWAREHSISPDIELAMFKRLLTIDSQSALGQIDEIVKSAREFRENHPEEFSLAGSSARLITQIERDRISLAHFEGAPGNPDWEIEDFGHATFPSNFDHAGFMLKTGTKRMAEKDGLHAFVETWALNDPDAAWAGYLQIREHPAHESQQSRIVESLIRAVRRKLGDQEAEAWLERNSIHESATAID